jgi:hypothetical protein
LVWLVLVVALVIDPFFTIRHHSIIPSLHHFRSPNKIDYRYDDDNEDNSLENMPQLYFPCGITHFNSA